MIWFCKSFIKFCKSFINLIKLVSTRTCSSARVRNYDDEMSALLIIVAKNWPKIMLKIGFWQKFNFELWQSLLWQSSTLGLSLAVPSSISYLDPHFCRRRRRRLPGTTQFPIRTLTQHKSGKLMLLASSIACAVTVLLRAKLRSVLQFWKSLHPHSILLFLVNLSSLAFFSVRVGHDIMVRPFIVSQPRRRALRFCLCSTTFWLVQPPNSSGRRAPRRRSPKIPAPLCPDRYCSPNSGPGTLVRVYRYPWK